MPELDETATIRQLPDGQARPARIRSQEKGRVMLVLPDETASGALAGAFGPGTLVEVQSACALFLGHIERTDSGAHITIAVEHFLDRAALEQIGRFWAAG